MKFSLHDEHWMARALMLAKRGDGLVSPNPMVGAVFVKGGEKVAEGWHAKFGGEHAEVRAISQARRAGVSLKGAELFTNLEPCCGYEGKKTPGCSELIASSGIRRVVFAMQDPNPHVSGKSARFLRQHKIHVEVGKNRLAAQKLNEKFCHWMLTGRPFVGLKVAATMDGKIATASGDSQWITGEESRAYVSLLRDSYDAILVGVNTVLRDNPVLKGSKKEPRRIILDSLLKTPLTAQVLRDSNVLVVTTLRAGSARIKNFEKKGIPCKVFPRTIRLKPLLAYLGSQKISSLFVEGGSHIFGSFFDEKLVNRLFWFTAPKILGGTNDLPAISGKGVSKIKNAIGVHWESIRQFGSDWLTEGLCSSL